MPTAEDPTQAGLNAAPGHPARGSVARACAALAVTLALGLLAAAGANAGEWVQVSCINPDQTVAGSAGWSSFASGGSYGSDNGTTCGPGGPAFAILSTDAAVPVGAQETLHYTPPAGSTLNGGLLDIGMWADGRGLEASGTAVAYSPEYSYNASNVFFQCASGLPACANGGYDFTGELEIPTGRGGDLYLSAGCGGEPEHGRMCNEGGSEGAWSLIRLWWANLRLSNDATPQASGVSGTLLEPGARGNRELLLTATDYAGPGIYNITVQAGGQTLYTGTPDTNGGQCVPAGDSAGALMFDSSQPCKQSETLDLPIETTAVSDGEHVLKITVTDAAGNSSVVYDAPIMTDNAPANGEAPGITGSGQPQTGETLSAEHGDWSAPAGTGSITYAYQWQDCDSEGNSCQAIAGAEGSTYTATSSDIGHSLRVAVTASDSDGSSTLQSGSSAVITAAPTPAPSATGSASSPLAVGALVPVANGAGAGEGAQLHLGGKTRISRPFAERALTVSGRLTNAAGAPISGAILDVREQVAGGSSEESIGHVTTAANGTFTVHAGVGASRTLLIGYRAFSTDMDYTAQASVQESVAAGVQLRISPAHTSPNGMITLEGHVEGSVPPSGVYVELLVHYHGAWQPFRDPHTTSSGRFRVRYQFQGAIGRFPFRAQALGGQGGFPYASGTSSPVAVTTG